MVRSATLSTVLSRTTTSRESTITPRMVQRRGCPPTSPLPGPIGRVFPTSAAGADDLRDVVAGESRLVVGAGVDDHSGGTHRPDELEQRRALDRRRLRE